MTFQIENLWISGIIGNNLQGAKEKSSKHDVGRSETGCSSTVGHLLGPAFPCSYKGCRVFHPAENSVPTKAPLRTVSSSQTNTSFPAPATSFTFK